MTARTISLLLGLVVLALPASAQNGGSAFVVPYAGGTNSGSGGSATNAQPPSIVLSNLAANANTSYTNVTTETNCYVTANGDTNRVVISGGGTVAARGTYVHSAGVWTQQGGNHIIFYDGMALLFFLSNTVTANDLWDTGQGPPFATWDDDLGGGAFPTGAFDNSTNCFVSVVGTGGAALALPVIASNVWFVSAASGNDTNNLRGRIDLPGRTFKATLADMFDGDTMFLWDGAYPFSSAGEHLYATNNIRIVGQSRSGVILGTQDGPEERIHAGDSNTFENFTLHGTLQFGIGPTVDDRASTNSRIRNCSIYGISDGIEADRWFNLVIEDSYIQAVFDGIADWDPRPNGSNRVMTLRNTHIVVTNSPSFSVEHGFNGGDSRLEMYGGSISVIDGVNHSNPIYLSMDTPRTNKTGSVLLSNVRIYSPNGPFVTNFNRLPVLLDNCTMEQVTPHTMVNNNFTNGWSDRFVVFTNTIQATNWLLDTRSLTSALVRASAQGHTITICDGGWNAGTSNLWVAAQANQKILAGVNAGPTITNVDANGGCATFRVVGTNWQRVNSYP